MSSGGGGYAKSTTTNTPWDVQGDYLRQIFKPGAGGMIGVDRDGNPLGDKAWNMYKGIDESGKPLPSKMQYVGDTAGLWGGEGLNAIANGTNKGLGSSTLKMTDAPTVAAFTPEEIAAQNIIKSRLQGYGTYQDTGGNTYQTGANNLIPTAKTALGNIESGANRVNPASFSAANVTAPSTINAPNINAPGGYTTPQIDNTNLDYKFWNSLSPMVSGSNQNQYLEDMITKARSNITNEFYNNTMPALDTTAESAGRYGSNTWANMRGGAYDKYQNDLKNQETALRSNAYNTNQSNALAAMNLGGTLAENQANLSSNRALNQAQLEAQNKAQTYSTQADINKLGGQLGLQANTAQAGNELQRAIEQAGLQQQSNQGNAGYQQQANVQNIANVLQSTGMAPALSQSDYNDIAKLAAVGESQGAKQQDVIDAFVNRFNFNQTEPMQRLGFASNILSGDLGGTTNSVAPKASSGGCF